MRKTISVVLIVGMILAGLVMPAIANEWDTDKIFQGGDTGYIFDESTKSNYQPAMSIIFTGVIIAVIVIAYWLISKQHTEIEKIKKSLSKEGGKPLNK